MIASGNKIFAQNNGARRKGGTNCAHHRLFLSLTLFVAVFKNGVVNVDHARYCAQKNLSVVFAKLSVYGNGCIVAQIFQRLGIATVGRIVIAAYHNGNDLVKRIDALSFFLLDKGFDLVVYVGCGVFCRML